MDLSFWIRVMLVGVLATQAIRAWRRGDRRAVIDPALLCVAMVALMLPETLQAVRYTVAGVALAVVLVRSVKRDLIDGSDKIARTMTIGVLVFVASVIPTLFVSAPAPAWTKYLLVVGGLVMFAALLGPFFWMSRLMFSANRLLWDLKRSRPPREADEKVLGIDLSVLRQPRDL